MIDRLERRIDREVKARFGPGVVRRVTLLQHDDDAAIEPGDLLVRVVIEAAGGPYGKALRHVLSIDAPPPVADEAREAVAGLPVTDGE